MSTRSREWIVGLAFLVNGYGSAVFVGAIPTAIFIYGLPQRLDLVLMAATWLSMTVVSAGVALAAFALVYFMIVRILARPEFGIVLGFALGALAGPFAARAIAEVLRVALR